MTNFYQQISELEKSNQPFAVATVVKTDGSVPGKTGFKMIVKNNGAAAGTVGGGALEVEVIKEAGRRLSGGESGLKEYLLSDKPDLKETGVTVIPMKCNGRVSIFFEVHGRLTTIYIFGGGHVGHALLHYLAPLNYHTILVDNREEFASPEKNPGAGEYVFSEYSEYAESFTPDTGAFAVVLTHSHKYDYGILQTIYKRKLNLKYVGVIASKSKAAVMISDLKKDLKDKLDLSDLHTPIGLKIGGSTAGEIALSVAAEIQAVRYGKKV